MEIGFNKRQLAHRNVHGGIPQRIYRKSPQVAENREIVEVVVSCIWEKSACWESTNPWLRFVNLRNFREPRLTVVINRLVGGELQPVEMNLPMKGKQNVHTTTE